jgi:hypothetical protein
VSSYSRDMAYNYAEGTGLRADAIEAQRERESNAAEAARERMAGVQHQPLVTDLFPGFCGRCGLRLDNPIHGRKQQ